MTASENLLPRVETQPVASTDGQTARMPAGGDARSWERSKRSGSYDVGTIWIDTRRTTHLTAIKPTILRKGGMREPEVLVDRKNAAHDEQKNGALTQVVI